MAFGFVALAFGEREGASGRLFYVFFVFSHLNGSSAQKSEPRHRRHNDAH